MATFEWLPLRKLSGDERLVIYAAGAVAEFVTMPTPARVSLATVIITFSIALRLYI